MLNRRRFLKIFAFTSLALSFLPSILLGRSFSNCSENEKSGCGVKSWLYGSPRRGCSTPDLSFGYQSKDAKGLNDFVAIHVPADFVSRIPHEQYLS